MLWREPYPISAIVGRADAGCSHQLPLVVDPEADALRVTGVERKYLDLASAPDHWPELQHLRRGTVRIRLAGFRVSHHCTLVVDSGGLAVVAPWRRKRRHHPVLPHESETDEVGAEATKVLTVRIGRRGVGRTRHLGNIVQAGKGLAVRPAERAQIVHHPVLEEKGMDGAVTGYG